MRGGSVAGRSSFRKPDAGHCATRVMGVLVGA
jgi:hypothetical protein